MKPIKIQGKNRSKSIIRQNIKTAATATTVAVALALVNTPVQAHVSISPLINVSSTGAVVRDAVSIGKTGYLFFRLGHGCAYGATTDVDPLTGLSLEGSTWGTHAFSVTIPYAAAINTTANVVANPDANPPVAATWKYGTLKAPKPGYRPGWNAKVVLNTGALADTPAPTDQASYDAYLASVVDDTYTVTWTAKSADFDVPAYAQDEDGSDVQTVFAEFEVSVSWAKTDQSVLQADGAGNSTVGNISNGVAQYFNTGQSCVASLSKKPATASGAKVTVMSLSGGRAQVKIDAPTTKHGQNVTLSADGITLVTPTVVLNAKGDATVTLSGAAASAVKAAGALVAVKRNGAFIGYKLGSTSASHTLQIYWNQQLASGAAAVESDNGRTESNQAPSIKVYTAQ